MIRRYKRLMLKITLVLSVWWSHSSQCASVKPNTCAPTARLSRVVPACYVRTVAISAAGRHVNSRPAMRSDLAQTAAPVSRPTAPLYPAVAR